MHNQRVDFPVKYKEYEVLTERWRLINPYGKEIEDMESFNSGNPSGEISYINDPNLYELYDIIQDPGQRQNIASQHPKIVRELNRKYEEWWEDISSGFDTYCETIVGSNYENPTTLYSHDAHRKDRDSIWVIHVEKNGTYEIKLSRWPQESNKRLSENWSGDKIIVIEKAKLKLGNIDASAKVTSEMKSAKFIVNLKAGTTCLQGWFNGSENNRKIRAEFAYIERLGPADPVSIERYQASEPNRLIKS